MMGLPMVVGSVLVDEASLSVVKEQLGPPAKLWVPTYSPSEPCSTSEMSGVSPSSAQMSQAQSMASPERV